MYTNNSSLFSGLVHVILVLVLIGALGALALSGSDLTNFLTNSAKAEAMRAQNKIDAEKAAIDLKNYETLQDSQTQMEQAKILAEQVAYRQSLQQQLDYDAQKRAQDLEVTRMLYVVLTGAAGLAILIVGLGLAILMIQWGRSRVLAARPSAGWQNTDWRKEQIALARKREMILRGAKANPAASSADGKPIPVQIPVTWQFLGRQKVSESELLRKLRKQKN